MDLLITQITAAGGRMNDSRCFFPAACGRICAIFPSRPRENYQHQQQKICDLSPSLIHH